VKAKELINQLHERDDIGSLDIPASGKRYARMSGKFGTSPKKFDLYMKMTADLTNQKVGPFKNKQAAEDPKKTF
jgi:hypothetical protein